MSLDIYSPSSSDTESGLLSTIAKCRPFIQRPWNSPRGVVASYTSHDHSLKLVGRVAYIDTHTVLFVHVNKMD